MFASAVQHVHSVAIRGALKATSHYRSMLHLCGPPRNLPYELILGMLRGDDILRIEQVGLLVFYLGPNAVPDPADVEKVIAAAVRKEAARMRRAKGITSKTVTDLAERKLQS